MELECGKCKQFAILEDCLKCNKCTKFYHFYCTGYNEISYRKLRKNIREKWICNICSSEIDEKRSNAKRQEVNKNVEDNISETENLDNKNEKQIKIADDNSQEQIISLNMLFQKITEKIELATNKTKCEIQELQITQHEVINDKLNKLKSDNEELKLSIEKLKENNQLLETRINDLGFNHRKLKEENELYKKEIDNLNFQILNLQIYTRKRNIEINGLRYSKQESMQEIVFKLAKLTGFDIKDVEIAHRINITNKKKESPIIIQFKNINARDQCIRKAKELKLKACDFDPNADQASIFVNEHLPIELKKIFYEARILKRQYNWKYIWIKNGNIFLRKIESSNVIKINSMGDLSKITN